MSKVVYGIFTRLDQAEATAAELNERPGGETYAVAHDRGLRDEDVQYAGTLALHNGVLTGMVVGAAGGFLIWAVLWPMLGLSLGVSALALLMIATSLFGIVAGAVAGAAEAKPELAEVAHREEAKGSFVVTCEAPARDEDEVRQFLREHGAAVVEAA